MAETCGGVGFLSNFAPTRKAKNPIKRYVEKSNQNRQIKHLEKKAETEGLTTREKVDLYANKMDRALNFFKETPTVMYMA